MVCCAHFKDYMTRQEDSLTRAIEEDKWYLSEQAGADVGMDTAVEDFVENHLDRFAHEFRVRYCRKVCGDRATCELARNVHEIASHRQMIDRCRQAHEAADEQ